jgi:hypothetical protein
VYGEDLPLVYGFFDAKMTKKSALPTFWSETLQGTEVFGESPTPV